MSERPGISIGRVAGIPFFLAPSWFVVALLVCVLFAPTVTNAVGVPAPASYLVAACYALLLLLSVLAHELAHAMVARALGLPVHEVVADLWGGHTQFTDLAPTAARTAAVAVAGPGANAAVAAIGWWLLSATQGPEYGVVGLLLRALVYSNVLVAVFNLAPGLPLDGGRIVECAVWALNGRRWLGTTVAGWLGRLVAVLVLAWALLPLAQGQRPSVVTVVWVALICRMLWTGAGSALVAAGWLRRAAGLDMRQFLQPAVGVAATSDSWARCGSRHVVALDATGRHLGFLTAMDAARLAAPGGPPPGTPLTAVLTVLPPDVVLPLTATGEQMLGALTTAAAPVLVVVDAAGAVVGLVDSGELAAAISATT